jgi:hypothetical protein
MGAWVIGRNLAGYLPESDTYAYPDHAEAAEAFVEMVREYADDDDERNDEHAEPDWADDDYGTMRATVDSILADGDATGPDGGMGMVVGDSDDRPISFWLMWSDDREPYDDE